MPRPVLVLLGLLLPPLLGVAVWAIALSGTATALGVSIQPTNSASRAAVSATVSATGTGQSTTASATRAEVLPVKIVSATPVRVQNTASGLCQPGSGSIRGPPSSQVDDDYDDGDDEYAQRDLAEGDYHVDLDLGADPANAEQLEGLGLKVRSGVYRIKDALAVVKMSADFVYKDDSGKIKRVTDESAVSRPIPEVSLQITSAEITSSGSVQVEYTVGLRDAFSESTDDVGQAVSQVSIYLNNELKEQIPVQYGAGDGLWTKRSLSFSKDKSIALDSVKSRRLSIRAEAINGTGNIGHMTCAVPIRFTSTDQSISSYNAIAKVMDLDSATKRVVISCQGTQDTLVDVSITGDPGKYSGEVDGVVLGIVGRATIELLISDNGQPNVCKVKLNGGEILSFIGPWSVSNGQYTATINRQGMTINGEIPRLEQPIEVDKSTKGTFINAILMVKYKNPLSDTKPKIYINDSAMSLVPASTNISIDE